MSDKLSNKTLENIICIACTEPFKDHSKRQLIRCCFRLQGTIVSDGIQNSDPPEQVKGFNSGVG